MAGVRHEDAAASFDPLRPKLMRVAYRMLGAVADAEDVIQEAFIRWMKADRSEVREPEAFLRRAVTRLTPASSATAVAASPDCERLKAWTISSRVASIEGVWVPPVTITRSGIASLGIFSLCCASTPFIASLMRSRFHSICASRSFKSASAGFTSAA